MDILSELPVTQGHGLRSDFTSDIFFNASQGSVSISKLPMKSRAFPSTFVKHRSGE